MTLWLATNCQIPDKVMSMLVRINPDFPIARRIKRWLRRTLPTGPCLLVTCRGLANWLMKMLVRTKASNVRSALLRLLLQVPFPLQIPP
jgi:hypothetical protein